MPRGKKVGLFIRQEFLDIWEKAKKFAKAQRMSISELVIRALKAYLEGQTKIDIKEEKTSVQVNVDPIVKLPDWFEELLYTPFTSQLEMAKEYINKARRALFNASWEVAKRHLYHAYALVDKCLQLIKSIKNRRSSWIIFE